MKHQIDIELEINEDDLEESYNALTIVQLQKPPYYVSEPHTIFRSPDVVALKLWMFANV